jgi:hypothetical protein
VFTGYGDAGVEAEAELVGAAAFVDKTTPLRELADILVKCAEG